MSKTIKIFQNYYDEAHLQELDPEFIPNDCRSNPFPEYREMGVFLQFHRSGQTREAEYVGILSPKFCHKANISGREFIRFIEANPGFDVYFINPFPQNAYHSFNVWEHGEAYHVGIEQLAQKLLNRSGYSISISDMGRNDHSTLAYCNYWVGNSKFWDTYMGFITPLFETIAERMSEIDRSDYLASTTHFRETPMAPFILPTYVFHVFAFQSECVRLPLQAHARANPDGLPSRN